MEYTRCLCFCCHRVDVVVAVEEHPMNRLLLITTLEDDIDVIGDIRRQTH